jgi:peptidoglycan hydrolase-like protein with peptidoglycan-binding domain
MSEPIIKLGSKGEAVKHAQQALISRGYTPLDDDGIFGPITRNRVIWYQLNRSVGEYWAFSSPLDVDGIVGPQTWFRLDPPTVKKNSHNNAVYLLQEILKVYANPDYDPGPVDGIFGPLTEAAVKNYQADYGLAVDGVVGRQTWSALGS